MPKKLVPSRFLLRRSFEKTGSFEELLSVAEVGDLISLFDEREQSFLEQCACDEMQITYMNLYAAVGAYVEKDKQRLMLFFYNGTVVADLGTHPRGEIHPIAGQGILLWPESEEGSADVQLIRSSGVQAIQLPDYQSFETDSVGNIYFECEDKIVRMDVTGKDVVQRTYFESEGLASNYLVSGNSLWVYKVPNVFFRVGPDGNVLRYELPTLTSMDNDAVQDEWLAVYESAQKTFFIFKHGMKYAEVQTKKEVESLVAVGSFGVVYGADWDNGEYRYFLTTYAHEDVLLTQYDEAIHCLMVPEGVILVAVGSTPPSLVVLK